MRVLTDSRDKYIAGVTQAVLAQAGYVPRDPQNEFNGVKPMDIVREVVSRNNIKATHDPMRMVASAITHSSGDFAQITANVAHKAMLKGFEETEETFQLWTSTGSLSDFKQARSIDLNALPSLPKLTENIGYPYLTTGDRGVLRSLTTAGGLFSISRQALINDDLDVFSTVPRRLGRAAKRTIGNDVYGLLAGNPAMSDNVALFHASHGNLGTGALSATTLQAMDLAMGLQKDRSHSEVVLNLVPKHIISPRAQRFLMQQLLRSTSIDAANPAKLNPVHGLVDSLVFEARLDASSETAWYAAADGRVTDTVQIDYLNGVQEPLLEIDRPFSTDGLTYKVRIDYGVTAMAWEGLFMSSGV